MNEKRFLDANLALRAISIGAELIEKRKTENLISGIEESPRDIVTELDNKIEKRITEVLKTSGYRIIGEEMGKNKNLKIAGGKPVWLIDPIDGTMNLISSVPFYAVSVGLLIDSKFVVGAVAIPPQKEIFFTMGDRGSFLNGRALRKVQPVCLERSLIAVAFSGNNPNQLERKQEYDLFGIINDKSRGCLRLGSATTNICYVAAGRLQAAYGIDSKIWDVAGALAVALQVGCHLYLGWQEGSIKLDYVVGAPEVTDEIANFFLEKKKTKLEIYETKSF